MKNFIGIILLLFSGIQTLAFAGVTEIVQQIITEQSELQELARVSSSGTYVIKNEYSNPSLIKTRNPEAIQADQTIEKKLKELSTLSDQLIEQDLEEVLEQFHLLPGSFRFPIPEGNLKEPEIRFFQHSSFGVITSILESFGAIERPGEQHINMTKYSVEQKTQILDSLNRFLKKFWIKGNKVSFQKRKEDEAARKLSEWISLLKQSLMEKSEF